VDLAERPKKEMDAEGEESMQTSTKQTKCKVQDLWVKSWWGGGAEWAGELLR